MLRFIVPFRHIPRATRRFDHFAGFVRNALNKRRRNQSAKSVCDFSVDGRTLPFFFELKKINFVQQFVLKYLDRWSIGVLTLELSTIKAWNFFCVVKVKRIEKLYNRFVRISRNYHLNSYHLRIHHETKISEKNYQSVILFTFEFNTTLTELVVEMTNL